MGVIHQRNDDMAPDSDFEPGELRFLVPGNTGRLLDTRRTPVQVQEIKLETGQFIVEILDFEDRGARWVMPFEQVSLFQFSTDSALRDTIASLQEAIKRFDTPLHIPAAQRPLPDLTLLRDQARDHLNGFTLDLQEIDNTGCPPLWTALRRYMEDRDLDDIEEAFAKQFVSNPYSGELVKGHRIVIAELGLVDFEGTAIRDPKLFFGRWSKQRRTDHILSRLAFIRELLEGSGHSDVILWRGISTTSPLKPPINHTFISTSFLREVAESIFRPVDETRVSVLYRQRVPIQRVFMTYLETEAMNKQFLEAESIVLFDHGNHAF